MPKTSTVGKEEWDVQERDMGYEKQFFWIGSFNCPYIWKLTKMKGAKAVKHEEKAKLDWILLFASEFPWSWISNDWSGGILLGVCQSEA